MKWGEGACKLQYGLQYKWWGGEWGGLGMWHTAVRRPALDELAPNSATRDVLMSEMMS
jgi:hypothetical protein